MNFGLLILHFLNTQIKNTLERERFEVNCVRNSAMRSSESQIRYFTCATRSVMIIQVYRVSEKNIYLLRHWWTIARNLGKKPADHQSSSILIAWVAFHSARKLCDTDFSSEVITFQVSGALNAVLAWSFQRKGLYNAR